MTKLNTLVAVAALALFASGSAFAGALQPADGQGPDMDQMVNTQSTLTRSAVEAQAAADAPVGGQLTNTAVASDPATAQVPNNHAAADAQMPASGEAPFMS